MVCPFFVWRSQSEALKHFIQLSGRSLKAFWSNVCVLGCCRFRGHRPKLLSFLKVYRTDVAHRRMTSRPVVEPLDVIKDIGRACSLDRYIFVAVRSVFSELKKLSTAELSQTSPARLMLQVTPWSLCRNPCLEDICRSRSEKKLDCCEPETLVYGGSRAALGEALLRSRES